MLETEFEKAVERLKMKKVELTNKINLSDSFDEKEEYIKELEIIQKQINVLEKLKTKS